MNSHEQMSIEDRVRIATQAGATLVRDVRPFAEPENARFRRRPTPGTRRWVSWGVPLAAAAAVALVALGLVAARHLSAAPPRPSGPAPAPTSVPRYYVALDREQSPAEAAVGKTGPVVLIVGDDRTGQAIATVNPPHGMEFMNVQGGASDDRSFVVMAAGQSGLPPYTWYLLRLAPGSARPYQLAKLPVKLPAASPSARLYALSPDGRDLAIESLGTSSRGPAIRTTLTVYSLATGAKLRAWSTDGTNTQGLGQPSLSWLSDGRRLAFSTLPPASHRGAVYRQNQLRTVDLAGSGTDLLADSRELLTVNVPTSSPGSCWTIYPTPDGGTVICGSLYNAVSGGTKSGCAHGGPEFTAYSVQARQSSRVLYRYPGSCRFGLANVLWSDASARQVIGALEIEAAGHGGQQTDRIGVISDGRLRPLPMAKALPTSAYVAVAF